MPPDFRAGKLRTLLITRNELQLWERGAWSPEVRWGYTEQMVTLTLTLTLRPYP